jgi:hypothetical protein
MEDVVEELLKPPMTTGWFDRNFLWHYRARPIRVIDGDTFIALVDTGFFGRHEVRIRIADINTPELGEDGGGEAMIRLQEVLGFLLFDPPPGWTIRVVTRQRETVVSEIRSFERYVADVYVITDGDMLTDVKELLT